MKRLVYMWIWNLQANIKQQFLKILKQNNKNPQTWMSHIGYVHTISVLLRCGDLGKMLLLRCYDLGKMLLFRPGDLGIMLLLRYGDLGKMLVVIPWIHTEREQRLSLSYKWLLFFPKQNLKYKAPSMQIKHIRIKSISKDSITTGQ